MKKRRKSTEKPKLAHRAKLQAKLMSILSAFTFWATLVVLLLAQQATPTSGQQSSSNGGPASQLQFEPERNSYTGLTFTFDPRLDKRVEWLHFEHWLSIVQQTSSVLYEALNGRAHLAEVRVLIPYKWRQFEWPVLHKPGSPIMINRRLRFADSDILVGFEGKFVCLVFCWILSNLVVVVVVLFAQINDDDKQTHRPFSVTLISLGRR